MITFIEGDVKNILLMQERLYVALKVSEPNWALRPEIRLDRLLEDMAYQLIAMLKVPAHEVQNQEIARWPDGPWQAVKWGIRRWMPWSMKVRFRTLWLREVLLFPEVEMPPGIGYTVLRWTTFEPEGPR